MRGQGLPIDWTAAARPRGLDTAQRDSERHIAEFAIGPKVFDRKGGGSRPALLGGGDPSPPQLGLEGGGELDPCRPGGGGDATARQEGLEGGAVQPLHLFRRELPPPRLSF